MNDLAERHTLLDACPERTSAMNSSGFWNLFHPVGDHTDRGEPAAGRAGITRAIYGLTDDAASDLLRRHSQHSNLKLRDLAARLTEALPAVDIGTPSTPPGWTECSPPSSVTVDNQPARPPEHHRAPPQHRTFDLRPDSIGPEAQSNPALAAPVRVR